MFGRRGDRGLTWAALAGGLLPDLSLYLMAAVSILLLGIGPDRVFGELYFSGAWQLVFAVDNSFVLWGIALGAALWLRSGRGVALTGSALLHLVFDLLLHHDDARRHFWPLSDWRFASPVSYWDPAHGGAIVAPIETALALICAGIILRQRPGRVLGGVAVLLAAAQFAPFVVWALVFGGQGG